MSAKDTKKTNQINQTARNRGDQSVKGGDQPVKDAGNQPVKETRLVIKGLGGQGVRFVTVILAKILQDRDFFVSCYFLYDAAMRGGKIKGELAFSPQPNPKPIGTKIDYLVLLDESYQPEQTEADKILKAGNNMLALGKILQELGINPEEIDIKNYLPQRNLDNNTKDINKGYSQS